MGRVLVVVGVLVMVVGVLGSVWAFVSPLLDPTGSILNPASSAIQAVEKGPQAEDLCQPGEKIVTEGGQSERGPDGDWRHPVQIYCVDDEGNRREVTANYAGDLMGQAFGSLPGFLGGIGLSMCFMTLVGVGLVVTLLGAVTSRRRRPGIVTVSGTPSGGVYTVRSGTSSFTRIPHSSLSASDLAGILRELEAARSKNLIPEDEYERLRRQILDNLS